MKTIIPIALATMLFSIGAGLPASAQPLLVPCTDGNSWINPGEGLPGPPSFPTTMNNDIYVCLQGRSTTADSTVDIWAWNGRYWRDVTGFTVRRLYSTVSGMTSFQNDLYVYGNLTDFNRTGANPRLVRWDGNEWLPVPEPNPALGRISAAVSSDRLYLFTYDTASNVHMLFWDGAAWTQHPTGGVYAIHGRSSDGRYLYISGTIRQGPSPMIVQRWDGSRWEPIGDTLPGVGGIIATGGELYFIRNYQLLKLNGTTWQPLPPIPVGSYSSILGVTSYKGQLYVQVYAVDTLQRPRRESYGLIRFDGSAWHAMSQLQSEQGYVNYHLIEHGNELLALGTFNSSCGTPLRYAAKLCDEGNCATLAGNVRYDVDRICETRAGERGLLNHIIEIQPGPRYAVTNAAGNYRAMAPVGSYSLSLQPHLDWTQVCPPNNRPLNAMIVAPGEVHDSLDFGEWPSVPTHDLRVDITHGAVRAGLATSITLLIENVGAYVERNVPVSMMVDARLRFDSASVAPMRISGNVIEWRLDSLAPEEQRTMSVYLTASRTLSRGDTVCEEVSVSNLLDNKPWNNQRRTCVVAMASYDPNEIVVDPAGVGADGVLPALDTTLTYTIRFQNTGNDTAFNVAVYDTLAPELHPATIEFGAASHPYTVGFGPGNALIWRFENIMLPDSTTNEARSHGYFSYSIRLRPETSPKTRIENRGSIYFDYNAPVHTNTVANTTPSPSAVELPVDVHALTIAPNPATDRLVLHGAIPPASTLSIRNMLGQHVRDVAAGEAAHGSIDLTGLPTGDYLLALRSGERVTTLRFMVVR